MSLPAVKPTACAHDIEMLDATAPSPELAELPVAEDMGMDDHAAPEPQLVTAVAAQGVRLRPVTLLLQAHIGMLVGICHNTLHP